MSEQYGFKTSFRGFSREDVLKYIDEVRLALQQEKDAHAAESADLRAQVADLQAQLDDIPLAVAREDELQTQLAAEQETVAALREQVAALTAELTAAQSAVSASREEELADSLSAARAEIAALREREGELTSQLAETHQAVAKLWQEKELIERKLAIALGYADRQQAASAELKAQLGSDTLPTEETGGGKPMERWLF